MSGITSDWNDIFDYIDFHEEGGDLEPGLDQYENATLLETAEKISSISSELMQRHLEATEIMVRSLNELKALPPLETGLQDQIIELQEIIKGMGVAHAEMLDRQAKIDREMAERKVANANLLKLADDVRRLLGENQPVPGVNELLIGGNRLCRYLGNTPEIQIKKL